MRIKFSQIGSCFVLWLVVIVGVVSLSLSGNYKPSFPYYETFLQNYGPRILTTFAQFDGVHYLTIVEKGYRETALIQAFFPFYPMMVKFFSFGQFNYLWVGLVISFFSFIGGMLMLKKLILIDDNESVLKKVLVLMMFSPVSFFFVCFYTESVFFLLLVSTFYFARTKKWWLAGLLGLMLSATRLVGVFIVPALLLEWFEQKKQLKLDSNLIWVVLPVLGLLFYMLYLYREFGDPLLFFHAQQDFGTGRDVGRIILLHQVFYRYFKMFLTVSINNPIFIVLVQEFALTITGLMAMFAGWFKIRRSYVVFSLFAIILPTLTGTLTSIPRYILPLFPFYLVLAKYLPSYMYKILLIIFVLLLILNLNTFTRGMWVA